MRDASLLFEPIMSGISATRPLANASTGEPGSPRTLPGARDDGRNPAVARGVLRVAGPLVDGLEIAGARLELRQLDEPLHVLHLLGDPRAPRVH